MTTMLYIGACKNDIEIRKVVRMSRAISHKMVLNLYVLGVLALIALYAFVPDAGEAAAFGALVDFSVVGIVAVRNTRKAGRARAA